MKRWSALAVSGAALVLATFAAAHGDEEEPAGATMPSMPAEPIYVPSDEWLVNYFRHPEHGQLMLWHIGLMTVGWAFILPVGELSLILKLFTIAFS